jgi:hypothetical protein
MKAGRGGELNLRVGNLVEVRSEEEILGTLDECGAVNGLPFMPEMLKFCGKRFRVEKRADKTCNTITIMESRRLHHTVHLADLRCNGEAHGGCQAQCFLFWKECWLKKIDEHGPDLASGQEPAEPVSPTSGIRLDRARLTGTTLRPDPPDENEIYYRCQATDLLKASTPLPWWDFRQYVRDVASGNVKILDLVKALLFHVFQQTLRITAYRAQIRTYNCLQSWRGGAPFPFQWGTLDKTPQATLNLHPGELVQIKAYDEILGTLSKKNKNRGLFFGPEMVPYCGSVRRVRARVERIIDERTGKLIGLPGECLILDGVVCRAQYSERRLFCPRNLFPFWREIWLKRVEESRESPISNAATDKARISEDVRS